MRGRRRAFYFTQSTVALALIAVTWHEVGFGSTAGGAVAVFAATFAAALVSLLLSLFVGADAAPQWIAAALIAAFGVLATAGTWFGVAFTLKAQMFEPGWSAAARHATRTPSWFCHPYWERAETITISGLGEIDTICARGSEVDFSQYEETIDGSFTTGVVYALHVGLPTTEPDSCLRHINGPWWQFRSGAPSCPLGFEGVGGG